MTEIETVALLTNDPGDIPAECDHRWVGGMCYIHPEDVETIASTGRYVECERCGAEWTSR